MIYLDSCLVIYLIERPENQGRIVSETLATALFTSAGEPIIGISPLVKCECLVVPIRRADVALQRAYHQLFGQFVSLDISEDVYLLAAELRARLRLNTPDAIHLACAQHHECEELWTNDDRLTRGSRGLARNVLGPRVI